MSKARVVASSKFYTRVLTSRHRYIVMFGGRSSAKSDTAAQKMVISCKTEKNFKGVCLRKIYADIKDSQFDTMWSVIERYNWESEFKYTRSPLEITHIESGRKILARGLDKPAKLKSINNPTMVWIEEADEIKLEDFIKSDTSIRHPDKNTLLQTIMSFNPESEDGWINEYFFPPKLSYEKSDGSHTFIKSTVRNTLCLHTTYKHNDFCSEGNIEVIKRLERLGKESNYYRVYVLGLWGNALKGLVYENYHNVDKFPAREDCKKYGYGLDFGFTNDPTAIIRCALSGGELYFEEVCYKVGLINRSTNGEHEDNISDRLKSANVGNDIIVADSAEPKSIKELRLDKWRMHGVKKGKDSVEAGIALVKQYRINIVGASPNLRKELKSYKYQEAKDDAQGEFLNKPIDDWNHALDALRYWVWDQLNKKKLIIV
jgi:phage terminase large subunit